MTSTAWVLRWFCGEFSPPAAHPTGHQPQCMETSIQSEFSFERFLEVQLIFGGRLTIWCVAWMCRRASLWATASSLHVNDLNRFSVRGQINQSDRCCGPHDAAVRAFCSVVTCLCRSLAPDIFAFLLWDSERCRCVQHRRWQRHFTVSSLTVSDHFLLLWMNQREKQPEAAGFWPMVGAFACALAAKTQFLMKLSVWSTSTDYLKQNFESVAADTNFILKCLSLIENNSVFSHELL